MSHLRTHARSSSLAPTSFKFNETLAPHAQATPSPSPSYQDTNIRSNRVVGLQATARAKQVYVVRGEVRVCQYFLLTDDQAAPFASRRKTSLLAVRRASLATWAGDRENFNCEVQHITVCEEGAMNFD